MAAAAIMLMTMTGLTSCNDNDDVTPTSPETAGQPVEVWKTCQKPTFISGIETEDPDFQTVIRQRFPNQVGSLSEAEIAFVSHATAAANQTALKDFYERGGLIVMMHPDAGKFDKNGDYLPGYNDEHFCDNEQFDELFYAYNIAEKHFTMFEEPPFDGIYDDEVTEMSSEEWAAIEEANKQYTGKSESNVQGCLYDNDYDQNENYFHIRMDAFIDFIEEIEQQMRSVGTRSGDDMTLSVDDGFFFSQNVPISLNHIIEKDFAWNKSSSITVKCYVSSAYMLSCNGNDKAGDYYLVKTEIIPHLTPLWEANACSYGPCRCRIYAYWFERMLAEYRICDSEENFSLDESDVQFYKQPIPENENTEVSYTNGFSWGINGSIGGQVGTNNEAQGNVGFSLQWSNSISYALKSIQYRCDTSSPYCASFTYNSNNVKLTDDDYEDETKTNKNFPEITHTEFTARTAWMWRVPYNESLGVADGKDTQFSFKMRIKPTFASWYHWRGAVEYDSNKKTYNGYEENGGWFYHIQELPAPDRTPWGILALRNAANNTVANIKIYKQDDYAEKGSNATVYATIPSSYNMNEIARKKLVEGTYTITFQTIDPNQNNKVLTNWKYEEISIHQGKNADEATTEISTVNAIQI